MNKELLYELREIKHLLSLQKRILNLDEFCSYTGISKSHVYHLTSTGKIKCYRPFGKMIFFDVEEVIEILKQNPIAGERQRATKIEKYLLKQIKN